MLLGGGITCSGGPAQALQWHGGGGSELVPALLSGLFPTLPWLLWRRGIWGVWRSLRADPRLEEAETCLRLGCPGRLGLAHSGSSCCLLLWSVDRTFHLPFALWMTQTWSHCSRTHSALTVPERYFLGLQGPGRWVGLVCFRFQTEGRGCFPLSLGIVLLFLSVINTLVPDAEIHLNLSSVYQEIL